MPPGVVNRGAKERAGTQCVRDATHVSASPDADGKRHRITYCSAISDELEGQCLRTWQATNWRVSNLCLVKKPGTRQAVLLRTKPLAAYPNDRYTLAS